MEEKARATLVEIEGTRPRRAIGPEFKTGVFANFSYEVIYG